MKKTNILLNKQNNELYHFMVTNRSKFKKQNTVIQQVADLATEALGFKVTHHNVQHMTKMHNLMWSQRQFGQKNKQQTVSSVDKELIQLQQNISLFNAKIAQLSEENATITRCLLRLADEWDIEFDNSIIRNLEKRSRPVATKKVVKHGL